MPVTEWCGEIFFTIEVECLVNIKTAGIQYVL